MSPSKSGKGDVLRRRAEAMLAKNKQEDVLLELKTVKNLAQELSVHQAELELQNEALRDAQTALLKARDRYTALYEYAPMGYVVLDASGIVRQTNRTWRVMLNREGDDFRGSPFVDNIVETDAAVFLARFRVFFRNPQEKHIVVRMKRRGADPFFARIEARPTRIDEWDVGSQEMERSELLVVVTDISESELARAELRRNEERLRTLVDILQYDAHDFQTFLDYALEKAIELTESAIGYIYFYDGERKEFVLNSWSKEVMDACTVIDPQTCYALDKTGIWGEAVRQRKAIVINDFAAFHPLKKGYPQGHVPLTRFLTVPVFSFGDIVAVVGVANKQWDYNETDSLELSLLMDAVWKTAENMRSREELLKREQFLQTILQTTGEGFWVIDGRGRFVDVNQAYCSLSGYSRDELLQMGISDIEANEDPRQTVARIRRIQEKGFELFETRHRRKDGSLWHVEMSVTWLAQDGGRFVCFGRDLSERRKAEEQLSRLQKAESLGRMAGAIAHNYNNQLAVVIGNLDLLTADTDMQHNPLLADAMLAAKRASEMGALMLSYMGQTVATRDGVDLSRLCRQVQGDLGPRLPRKLNLRADLPAEGLTVSADEGQIKQVLSVLIANAAEAMEGRGGEIEIKLDRVLAQEIDEAYVFPAGFSFQTRYYARLRVIDRGCGIRQSEMLKLCDPFYTTKFTGRGMGLPVAVGILNAHEGCLAVHSEFGSGSTFAIFLPL